jgi:HK97 family phage portal protein
MQLWPLHPANVYTRRDDETGDLVYAYHIGSAQQPVLEFPSADVVHFKNYNPDDQVRGMSRLEPLRSTLLNEDASRAATQAFWQNGARPSVLLSTAGTISEPAAQRLKADWDRIHRGVENWSKTAILEEGLTPHIVQLNAEEMQYVESRRLNREEACAIYDVPPPAVHILDRATFSNITEQNRMVYRDTMAPRLGLYESVLDTQLRPDFDPQGNTYAEFLLDEVLRGDFEARSAAYAEGDPRGLAQAVRGARDGEPDARRGRRQPVHQLGNGPAGHRRSRTGRRAGRLNLAADRQGLRRLPHRHQGAVRPWAVPVMRRTEGC